MKHWRQLAAIILAGIMVFALAACNLAPKATEATPAPTEEVEAPTGEGVQNADSLVPVVDPETYREFIYTWYADGSSASYKLNIKDDGTWEMLDAAKDVAASGTLRMNEEDQILEMYDPDGSLAISATLEKEDTMHVDIMMEALTDALNTNVFLNKITNDISDAPPTDMEASDDHTALDEETTVAPPAEEEPIDG